jgi:hypothetical protein
MDLRYHDRTEAPVESARFVTALQRDIARAENRQAALEDVHSRRPVRAAAKKKTGPQSGPVKFG